MIMMDRIMKNVTEEEKKVSTIQFKNFKLTSRTIHYEHHHIYRQVDQNGSHSQFGWQIGIVFDFRLVKLHFTIVR